MRVVAMISGGKDSCYNMMQCVAEGHDIVALANLHPKDRDELDSYMYQTVGHMGIETLAKAMKLPLYRRKTKGLSTQRGKQYTPTDNDEVEDLYSLLALCKDELQVEAVAVGAILSDYQRVRVENVCSRLNLVSLAYLWGRDQTELLQEMIDCQVHAILIKVASLGLLPDRHLGKSLREIHRHLLKMHNKYGMNVCGEGGEYETFTLDCPLFKQRIVIEDMQIVVSSSDSICPVGYINFLKLSLETKETQQSCDVIVKKSLDYLSDLNESTYSDLSDPDLSETELELIEKETRIRESLSQNELMSRSNSLGRHLTTASSSPIPLVTKSASVDEHTPSTLLSSSNALYTARSLHTSRLASPRFLGSSTTAICGSLSMAVSSLGISANCGSNTNAANAGKGDGISLTCLAATDPTSSLNSFIQPPSPFKYERETRPLNNQPMVAINQQGWMWVAGIQGCAPKLEEGLQNALETLRLLALQHKYEMVNYCYITLYMRSIAEFAKMNHIYGQMMNFPQPPTRVCVECPLPENYQVIIEAIAYKAPKRSRTAAAVATQNDSESGSEDCAIAPNSKDKSNVDTKLNKRHTMHVQSISHWAPASIGPYSQSTKINEITYISGQIALVPGSMTIIEGGIRPQCKLTLRHLARIAKAMNAHGELRDVVHGICFVVHPVYIAEARRLWERRTTNAIMDYIVVPALPREALVEWQVWAHTHNDRFEYEETGCSVDNYTISIRRRWNYENNCAAIVCYVTTGLAFSATQLSEPNEDLLKNHVRLAKSLTGQHLTDIFHYVINRLLKGYPLGKSQDSLPSSSSTPVPTSDCGFPIEQNNNRIISTIAATTTTSAGAAAIPAISLKIFYQVTAAPSIELLLTNLDALRHKYRDTVSIVFTVLPACSLHNFSTFLSICGVRHE